MCVLYYFLFSTVYVVSLKVQNQSNRDLSSVIGTLATGEWQSTLPSVIPSMSSGYCSVS